MTSSVIQLKCTCNSYPWGKLGEESLSARLCSQTNSEFTLKKDEPYSEMWMGTYPVQPAYVLKTGENLQEVLNKNKEELIGKTVLSKFGADLPYLPKILSIAKALPLQIHPNIELSKKLHEKEPEKFGDTNHKPEIAVALSFFEAFCGFKPLSDIQALVQLEPLQKFVPDTNKDDFNDETLKNLCRNMLEASEDAVASALESLEKVPKAKFGKYSNIPELIPRLKDQYGKTDNGSLVALICMNFLTLQPGEAIWIPADGIHAYLSGDIVECMARSDNVLNTGFCPRADRDSVETFVQALTFKQHDAKTPILPETSSEFSSTGKTTAFKPPMSEFNMLKTELKSGETERVKPIAGPSILFVTSGDSKMEAGGSSYDIAGGYIYFIGQGVEVKFEASSDFVAYRAYAE